MIFQDSRRISRDALEGLVLDMNVLDHSNKEAPVSTLLVPPECLQGRCAGYDLCATQDITLKPLNAVLSLLACCSDPRWICWVCIALVAVFALKQGLSLVNTPGLIDSNYREN